MSMGIILMIDRIIMVIGGWVDVSDNMRWLSVSATHLSAKNLWITFCQYTPTYTHFVDNLWITILMPAGTHAIIYLKILCF